MSEAPRAKPLLTARWSYLTLFTFAVPPEVLQPRVPDGVELDTRDGRAFVSVVGLDFHETRVFGVGWPGYRDFSDINFRFYVRRGERRGVVFVREIVPHRLVAWAARVLYDEPFVSAVVRSRVDGGESTVVVERRFEIAGRENVLRVVGRRPAFMPAPGSDEDFFKERAWGYGRARGGHTEVFEVRHHPWEMLARRQLRARDRLGERLRPRVGDPARSRARVGHPRPGLARERLSPSAPGLTADRPQWERMEQPRSDDERRREGERQLLAASGDAERGRARVRLAAGERRRGELDLAALALEQALREGAGEEAVGPELAAVLAVDPGTAGARRAAAAFGAVPSPGGDAGPFPLHVPARAAQLLAKRAELFRAVFRALPRATVLALARSVAALVPGHPPSKALAPAPGDGSASEGRGAGEWRVLGREVEPDEARALGDLYGRLLGVRRHRACARVDTPGPMREAASSRFEVSGDDYDLALADSHLALVYRSERAPEQLVLYDERTFAGQAMGHASPVLAGASADLEPRAVAAAGGTWVLGVDRDSGELVASFSTLGRSDSAIGRKRVGKRVRLAAACPCARGLAVFLAPAARALSIATTGEVSRERRLGAGLEVVDAASHGGGDVFVLLRTATEAFLQRLDGELLPLGPRVALPRLRSAREARLVWPTADLVLVLEPPDVAHAVGADDRRVAWTATIGEPLEGLAPVAGEALELLSYGPIESEWGLAGVDAGVARWTRDGLGRHGLTVRVESHDPSRALDSMKVATHAGRVALAYRSGASLELRTLEVLATPAASPPPAEWVYSLGDVPAEGESG